MGSLSARAINRLDNKFSEIIRRWDTDWAGNVECYTCGTLFFWKHIQCGHLFVRNKWSTRYNFLNAHPQCQYCNETLGGNMDVYLERFKLDYGKSTLDWLRLLSNQHIDTDYWDLEDCMDDMIAILNHKSKFDNLTNYASK